jgi:hypothetical protein
MTDSSKDAPIPPFLLTRLDTLSQDIRQTEVILRTIKEPLFSRIEGRLGTQLHRLRRRTEVLRQSTNTEASASWAQLHRLTAELGVLSDECLALAAGGALRQAGAASMLCEVADRLLDEVIARAPLEWSSFTIPATQEYYVRSSRVIRVRLPGSDFWDLPAAVHELGHFVGPAIADDSFGRTSHPFEDTLERLSRHRSAQKSWFAELFADAFATWAIGPSYGFMCVGNRLDPVGADLGTPTHPAASLRIGMIHATLVAQMPYLMDETRRLTEDSANLLEQRWLDLTHEAGSAQMSKDDTEILAIAGDELVGLLDEYLPLIRWDDWLRSQDLVYQLRDALSGVSDSSIKRVPFSGYGLRDLLNAAWRVRFSETVLADQGLTRELKRIVDTFVKDLVSPDSDAP